jgi:sigma-B regulation protein RsbU (phosphoserine phosphatase)
MMFAGFVSAAPVEPAVVHPALRGFALTFKAVWAVLLPAVFCWFFATFPAQSVIDRRAPWVKQALMAAGLVVAMVLGALLAVAGDTLITDRLAGWIGLPTVRAVAVGYALAGFGLGGASLVLNTLRAPTAEAGRRIRVILWGTLAGATPMLAMQAMAGAVGRTIYDLFPYWVWAPAVVVLFLLPLSFAYAVVKYRVLEIPVLIKRSARYVLVQRGLVVVILVASLAATAGLAVGFERLFEGRTALAVPSGIVTGVVFGLVLAWAGARVQRGFTRRIDQLFFRGAYDAREILEELARQARRSTTREELAGLLDRSVRRALHPVTLIVYLEKSGGRLERVIGQTPPALATLDAGSAPLADLAARGEPVAVERGLADVPDGLEPLGGDCFVPLGGHDGRLAGLLVLGPRMSEEPYSREDRRLLAAVSTQAGLALDNIAMAERMAERLEADRIASREMEIAQAVQRKLFPQRSPVLRTITYAGRCLQARAVGGDYYDFLDYGDSRLGLVLADISGKGISAALLMANLQANLRSQNAGVMRELEALLESVDRLFFEATTMSHYATLFFGRYDDRSRRLDYANCGHCPPLIVGERGAVSWLEPTTGVMGLFDTWRCSTSSVELEPGAALVIYSDGVTEAMSDSGELYGEERLVELVQAHRHLEAPVLLETIVSTVLAFSGRAQEDDLTLVVAKGLH